MVYMNEENFLGSNTPIERPQPRPRNYQPIPQPWLDLGIFRNFLKGLVYYYDIMDEMVDAIMCAPGCSKKPEDFYQNKFCREIMFSLMRLRLAMETCSLFQGLHPSDAIRKKVFDSDSNGNAQNSILDYIAKGDSKINDYISILIMTNFNEEVAYKAVFGKQTE